MNIPSQHLHIYFLYICELKKKASRIKSIKLTLLCKSRVSRFYVRVSSPFLSGCGQPAWALWQQWSSFNCAMGAASLLRSLMSSKDLDLQGIVECAGGSRSIHACDQVPCAPQAASAWTPCNAICPEEQSKVFPCIQ